MHTIYDVATGPPTHSATLQALVDGFDESIDAVADDVATVGWSCLRNVVTDEWLRAAEDCVTNDIDLEGKQELLIEDFAATPGTFARHVFADHRVERFLHSVAQAGLPRLQPHGHELENELRLVSGPPPPEEPLWFHYDGTAVTMVIPIVVPTSTPGESGELIMCPNRRPFRRSVAVNIVEKVLSQNNAYRRHFVKKLRWDAEVTTVTLEPGNAYVFSGYRSYHATLPCPPDSLRATLILHFGEVHQDSKLLTTTRSVHRAIRERRHRWSSRVSR